MDIADFLAGLKADLVTIFDKLGGHPVAQDVAGVVQKIEGVTEGDAKADAPELKGDVEKTVDDVKTDAEGLVHDVAGAVEGEATPAAPQAPEAAPAADGESAPAV